MSVTLTRGVLFGRYSEGQLTYNDRGGDVHLPTVPNVTPTHPTDHTWLYSNANDVRFRSTGPTKLTINAQVINLSVAGKGTVWLSVAGFDPSFAGTFSVDDQSFCEAKFQKLPVAPTRFPISSPVSG